MTALPAPAPAPNWRSLIRSKDSVLVITLALILGLLIIPMPPLALDLLIAANLALALGIMLLSMYIQRPMDFNAFPTVLLLLTLLRLGLNMAISRAILLSGDAGKVITIFGNFVVGGNYVVGVVVFLMLMIIQFIVITNGSGRVAEVAARFTLDAMPGKQLSIDADLNAGIINEDQARARRKQIQQESDFYGSMDGASKFVRGDATASIIIVIVNVIGGFVIGIAQRQLSLVEALQTYTLLTVGAGLVIQISALLVSTATGMIVTRTASDVSLGTDVVGQLSNFQVLALVTVIITGIGLIPGMPTVAFLGVGAAMGGLTYFVWRTKEREAKVSAEAAAAPAKAPELEGPEEAMRLLGVDPLELEIGYGLIPLVGEERAENLLRRVTAIRRQIAGELGIVLPKVRIRDNLRLQPQAYRVKVRGEEVAQGELMLDRYLAIPGSEAAGERLPGIPTTEPAFGLPALWITEAEKGRAELMGYTVVDALTVLSTHLTEVTRAHAPSLLGRQEVQEMLERLKREAPAVVDGLIPELLTLGEVQDVFRNLLRERLPIRDLGTILEVLANSARITRDPDVLAEAARQALARTLSNQYRAPDGRVHVFTLAPQLEATLKASLGPAERGLGFQIDARLAQEVIARTGAQMEQLAQGGFQPILLCPRELRLAFRRLVERTLPNLVVMAFSEISAGTQVQAHGLVELPNSGEPAMITRKFRAPDMPSALEDVQRSLGPEALVVSVRQVPGGPSWQVWRKAEVEVLAMAKDAPEPKAKPPAPAPSAAPLPAAPADRNLAADVAQVKTTLTEISSRLDRFASAEWSIPLKNICKLLSAQGVSEEMVRRLVANCLETLNPRALENESLVREQVRRQLEAALTEAAGAQSAPAAARLICLVGLSGAGKTTTLAKLAAHFTRKLGLHAAWICADTYRAGAIAQARIYAEALKLPLRVAYTARELAQAVEAEKDADLILVDTPACNPRRSANVVELGELLTALPQRTTYLVAPATAKQADLQEALVAFKPFDIKGLVLTKLDETRTFGDAFNLVWRSQLPVVYLSNGPEASDELQPAQPRLLVNALFGEGVAR